jgi:hypothetical protein
VADGAAPQAAARLISKGFSRGAAPTAGGEINIPIRFSVPGAP